MALDTWFWIFHAVALAGWIALLFRPGPQSVRIARIAAALLAGAYTVLFLLFAAEASVLAADYSLRGVGAFFSERPLLLLGWVHYLAFDLFVGSWEAEEGERAGLSRAVVAVCLVLTFMLGPVGLLLFLALRRRKAAQGSR